MSRDGLIRAAVATAGIIGLLLTALGVDAIVSFFGLGMSAPYAGAIWGGILGYWFLRASARAGARRLRWLALPPALPWAIPLAALLALNRHGVMTYEAAAWLILAPTSLSVAAAMGSVFLARGFRWSMGAVGLVHSLAAPLVMILLIMALDGRGS